MTINDFAMMEPMKYYNNETQNEKRTAILENHNGEYVATEKHDGDWSMCIHYTKGKNLIRSRSISKVTGVYGDYTAKLPHLVADMDNWPNNTVVLAEICWNSYDTNANTVGTILRCLPAKAVERQRGAKLFGIVFDLLMLNGKDYTPTPYYDRLMLAYTFFCGTFNYFKCTRIFESGFEEAADSIIAAGGEGCVIQRRDNPYMSGTRTAWKTLKLKQSLPHLDVQVVGTLDPIKEYRGDTPNTWQYRINGEPVTKPYYMGWKNGVVVQLPSGLTTEITSGLTDDDRAYLSTSEAMAKIAAGELWAEVKAMSINDLGKLRHGSLVRLRTDLTDKGE